uniref:Protein TOPAZ1 n=1 Tax=Meleagris gallopavo TaxID=9103 RepID=G1NFF0_MELGA
FSLSVLFNEIALFLSSKEKTEKNKQNSGIQAVKKCKSNLMRSENPCEKESHFLESPAVDASSGTQSKIFLCHPETKKSGVQLRKRKPRTDSIKCLQNLSLTAAEKVINAEHDDTENSGNSLNSGNNLLDVTRKNPFVRLEACSCISTLVKSSVNGATSTLNVSGFFHKAQDERNSISPGDTVEWSDINCSTNRMQNERSLIKDSLVFNKEVKAQHKGHFLCNQSKNSKFSSEKKCNTVRKSRKKMKITEMSAMQTVFPNVTNECSKCELPAEAAKSTKLLAFEDSCKKTSDLSIVAEREDSNIVASQCRFPTSGSLRALTHAQNVSNHHSSMMDEKLNKVKKKLRQFTCQRAIPMTGKHVWPIESCARTSGWVPESHGSVSEGKIILRNSAVTGSLRQLVLHTSLAEVNKEPAHKIMDLNADCLTSVEISESSSVGIYETCRMSNENAESPVNMVKSAVSFNHDDLQEEKATSNFTSAKDKGAVTKRNLSVAGQNSASKGKRNGVNLDHEASVVNQMLSELKQTAVLNTRNLTSFKIPLRRNKPESGTLEPVSSFESKTGSPPELDSTSVSGSQKRDEKTTLMKVKQQPLPVVSDAVSPASMKKKADEVNNKDFWHDGSEKLSDEMSVLPDPKYMMIANQKSIFHNTKNEKFPDVLEAYNKDVLVIDVIQDDPDLFGTSGEEELTVTDSENCPAKACCSSIFIKEEKQYPECAVTSENSHSVNASDIKTHNSSSGNSPMQSFTEDSFEDGQLTELDELLKSFELDEKVLRNNALSLNSLRNRLRNPCTWAVVIADAVSSTLLDSCNGRNIIFRVLQLLFQQILEMINLPRRYCRFYFVTLRGCERSKCWFWHVPKPGHEKICMAILKTYISINESGLLKRAGMIFVRYYREVARGENFDFQVLNDLLICLLKKCLLQELFQMLNVTAQINTLPALEVLLRVFECVASLNIRDAVPTLISTFCKLVNAGMFLEYEHLNYIIKLLHQLQVPSQEIDIVLNIKSRYVLKELFYNYIYLHCKEKNDWAKLGALYVNARTACENSDDLQKLSLRITEILTKDSEKDRPGVPFCDFADAVIKNSQCNEADRIFIGRAGISVMNSYRRVLQWIKGRKVLDKLQELRIHFTVLKGITGAERLASRCQIVNNAAEIFLETESLDGATWVLRESEWITNAPLWPCTENDIMDRHNLLFSLMHKYIRQSFYRQAFEVLQNLPGFQIDTVDVSQYSHVFNKLLSACYESKNLGVSSSAVDFMLSKNVAVDFFLLRGLITGLGRSCLWSKARTYYKTALSLGCYPPLQGNLRHKILPIPFYVSEVEMLLAIELFLVSNASAIQSPGATTQSFQIILKRYNSSDYQAGRERLILAARISDPKLFIRHMTVNVNMEEVYSLELTSALKWLKENMKWAGKVWLFQ